MKKTLLVLAVLMFLGTLAFGQCLPPVVNGLPVTIGPGSAPDYFNCANYASSPLPKRSCSAPAPTGTACYGDLECSGFVDPLNPTLISTCNGPITGGGIHKFVDTLPDLQLPGTNLGINSLGNYIPLAVPDTTTYPGSDYYEIGLKEYKQQFHQDLPLTKLRGYCQLNDPAAAPGSCTPHYLGPTILATKDRPVRILFRNLLPTGSGGDLFVPVDTTVMGAGMGPDMGGMLPADGNSVNDAVRNPMCNVDPKPAACFTENRATLHLHGGLTPWISDGTPHQWITPAGELAQYPDATILPRKNEGVSVVNVPDMPDPGPGAQTFFYTNQQSARLMFYHDHAWGITRLNVYTGEAAGYVVTDPTEQALMAPATATAPAGPLAGLSNAIPYGIPLIIQEKTFIPTPDQLATEDPTWNATKWGGLGSLWVPHVYMPAQDPNDPSGMSAFGRWMYGPYFWPPASPMYPPIANPYFDPTCDANVVGWCQPPLIPGTPNLSVGMEHFNDTPVVNGTAYPKLKLDPGEYRFRILNASNDRFWNLQWYVADASGTEVALNAAELAAAQLDPNIFPTPDTTVSPAGPAWLQIGTEGGFLPAPVVIPNQVTTWIIDPTRFDVGNVDKHALLIAPAERADVLVDFTPFAGKTLILYNDAPAAFPARVGSYDYYTGAPDQTDAGGAPSPQPGYGPNTRTIMQVVVGTGTGGPGGPANYVNPTRLAALQAAFAHHADGSGVFESSQDPIIVGQAAYNSAYGTAFRGAAPRNGVARISDFSMTFNTLLTGNDPANVVTIPFQPKALHDEMNSAAFDEYGRMTANMGFEAPNPGPVNQNIVLYPYINPPIRMTDGFIAHDDINGLELPAGTLKVTPIASAADGTEIWKITHNGVDTHPIHFHLFNVQLLNRVAWDNRVIMPDANELGWKDTIRMSPLSDTIVAVRPIVPKIPFGVPDSRRPTNPAMPIGDDHGYANLDPNGDPLATAITNQITDFGWEYVWHCHILGHEEMDMMRPLVANVSRALPAAPVVSNTGSNPIAISWTDGTPVSYTAPQNWGDPSNEIGYRIERASVVANTVGPFAAIGSALANQVTFTDTTADPTLTYSYKVIAYNAAGESPSAPLLVFPATPTTTTILAPAITYGQDGVVTVNVTSGAGTVTGNVTLTVDGVPLGQALTGGAAVFPLLKPALGTHTLVANYAAQATFAASNASGLLLVNQAPLTITASNANVAFGAPIPAITSTVVGLTNGDTLASLGAIACTTTATQGSPVGAYPSTCSGAVNANYAITYVAGTVTIGGVPLTITASSANVAYGSPVPAITPTVVGLVNGDQVSSLGPLTCSTTAAQGSAAGTYPSTCSGAVNANYAITYVAGAVTIAPVPLTITANNATRAFGAANPTFTATYAGFVNGNTPASLTGNLSCTTTATAASLPGPYPITCSGQTSTNYTISYIPGVLTVTAAGPVLALQPTALTFSSLPNVTTAPQLITVSNAGSAPLRITGISLGGANVARFGLTHNCPIGGTGLVVGGNCTINVTFTPNNNSVTPTALVRVNVAAPAVSQTVALTGTSIVPAVSVTPTSIAFGSVPIRTISAPQTVTVNNTGAVPLVFSSISLGGTNPGRFQLTNNCPIGGAGLAVGATCTVDVTFSTTRLGAASANLNIRHNAPGGIQRVALTGTGI